MPTSVFGNSFYDDSNEDIAQLSPGFRPGSKDDDPGYEGEVRRPSVASQNTAGSSGSKTSSHSRSFHKKLHGFFGDEYAEAVSRQNSQTSLPPGALYSFADSSQSRARHRNNSFNHMGVGSRPASPRSHSRPRTPLPSSEVTPWEFQDMKEPPASTDRRTISSNDSNRTARPSISTGHKLHLPGHRHSRSKEDHKVSDPDQALQPRPRTSREGSVQNLRRADYPLPNLPNTNSSFNSKTSLAPRAASPTPSAHSGPEFAQPGPKRKGTVSEFPTNGRAMSTSKEAQKRDHHRLPFVGSKKGQEIKEAQKPRDPNVARSDAQNASLWFLDTDLSNLTDIINPHPAPMTPPGNDSNSAPWAGEEPPPESKEEEPNHGGWEAPESWAVKNQADENLGRLRELDDSGFPTSDDQGTSYGARIFRHDSTFMTVSLPLNATVNDIIQMVGKRTVLQDELNNYHIVMKKHDTSRQLDPQERPLAIQKRLLEQAGYTDIDRIDEVGREDNSYLCRFIFLPAKMTGYSTLDKDDPGFNKMQKFNHIDLSGKNLITIPITLYQKANEIVSLNLSRNLSLDVPKDFIQACVNLRDIKYRGNEAWKLPPSLSLANRLTMLDLSNNRLEQLEHAELYQLESLLGLKLANNRLTHLPTYFGQFRFLRSLNLSCNSLTEFPDFLCDLKNMGDLDISFNSISAVPKIGRLTKLERLWATNNRLTKSFPASITNLTKLKEVDVRFNAMESIDVLSQLPQLEYLLTGHNRISAFEGTFARIRVLEMDHNPVTRFGFSASIPSLSILNLASAKLAQLPDDLFQKAPSLTRLNLDKNHFVSLSPHIGRLAHLEHFTIARNLLSSLPKEIGRLGELKHLDIRANNLTSLPPELWYARKLETLNVSANVLDTFPKPGAPLPNLPHDPSDMPTPGSGSTQNFDELGRLEDFQSRRPSQASGYLSVGSSSGGSVHRKGSMSSSFTQNGRKGSAMSRATTEGTITPVSRKDSSLSGRLVNTFASSLKHLFLADNRLPDDIFDELALLPDLRILNLSYNLLYDIPPRTLRRWPHLTELYLSGNDLTTLPAEDLDEVVSLRVLHINGNKFQVLPAELAKIQKLAIMDVGSNLLKYNVNNWPYDWNWNWNHNLRYLNLSGNKRLEIKPTGSYMGGAGRGGKDLTDFTSLSKLRILGLMDVTLMVPSVPDQTEDRRVRTSGSTVGSMAYGMADSLGRNEHLSILDLIIPRFRNHDDETLVGMFDGQPISTGGSKVAKYLHESFKDRFTDELEKLRGPETPVDALRRTYLTLNKDLAIAANSKDSKTQMVHRGSIGMPELGEDDLASGSVATVLFLKDMELFVSNVGDAQALLIQSEGGHKMITQRHDPATVTERLRIRDAGGFVSRQGKLNDVLEVSRAFGYISMTPAVTAAPQINHITLRESDEIILIASRELWEYLTPEFAVDVARSERSDLMRAAQKLRDLAIAFGATNKIMVMMLGVSDLRRRERARFRTHSMSMGPISMQDDFFTVRQRKRGKEGVADQNIARLDPEVDAPVGEVSLVFTDIKNSTLLWETFPIAMRSAIKMHNELMRRQLRLIGGYEVKTEGDSFMVAFPTVTSALLWSFTVQSQLLEVPWPEEILNSVNGQEVFDGDGNIIFKGLSVRMGIHWGAPVCEVDPVTRRMDYFGPMVNRASRISSVADGGQITVSSDFIAEIQRLLETHYEYDRSGSTGSDDTMGDDILSHTILRELRSLSSQGFEVKDLGERRLKGLENPERVYLMYPHALANRLLVQQQRAESEKLHRTSSGLMANKPQETKLIIDAETVWSLWSVSLRLEMLCSTLEDPDTTQLKAPETAILERMRTRSGELTDRFLINFVEHQVSRIETCVTTLALRNMVRPFQGGLLGQACPMDEILTDLTSQLGDLQRMKAEVQTPSTPSP
ncbi:adenylate cyclase protein [Eremomyces bilateralis CBS 781.70]|uniref:Adenylate cyclase n=1 Tax=Eremomyces bilateralis CBS 781.70 TaxID=1392243 RepID=A0A6G1FTB4_9PEZI|nr:adenylate cyclase protein [Eremomyces bilateralis CBS 781.70]KAF1809004.1 adenylate cyclase protein [Eremomyces bilateralis CBS 781.70]